MNKKTAIDQNAKSYWAKLYGEYGEDLCRDIPRRIKAALVANSKVASVSDQANICPVASAQFDDNIVVEGLFNDDGAKMLFRATLDKAGNVAEVKTIQIK